MSDFESLPSSVGQLSTKFWLRDYEKFIEENFNDGNFASEDFVQNLLEDGRYIFNLILVENKLLTITI